MLLLLDVLLSGHEDSADRLLEGHLDAVEGARRAHDVLCSADLLSKSVAFSASDRVLIALRKTVDDGRLVKKIRLGADEDDGDARAEVLDLGVPLGTNILKRGGRDDAIDHEENVGLRVGERAQAIIVVLTSRVPQAKVHDLAVAGAVLDLEECRVVVEDGGRVVVHECVSRERDQKGGLAYGAIANDDTLDVADVSSRHVGVDERS